MITVRIDFVLHWHITQAFATRLTFQRDRFLVTVSKPFVIEWHNFIPRGADIKGESCTIVTPESDKGVIKSRLAVEYIALPDGAAVPCI